MKTIPVLTTNLYSQRRLRFPLLEGKSVNSTYWGIGVDHPSYRKALFATTTNWRFLGMLDPIERLDRTATISAWYLEVRWLPL